MQTDSPKAKLLAGELQKKYPALLYFFCNYFHRDCEGFASAISAYLSEESKSTIEDSKKQLADFISEFGDLDDQKLKEMLYQEFICEYNVSFKSGKTNIQWLKELLEHLSKHTK